MKFRAAGLIKAVLALLVACEGGPSSVNDQSAFTISLGSAATSVNASERATTTISLTPSGGFTGAVLLSLINPPSGVTISPSSLNVTNSSARTESIFFQTINTSPIGEHVLTVQAESGNMRRTATFNLTINAAHGSLDPSFDSDGVVIHRNAADGNGPDAGNAVIVDSADRILVAGFSVSPSTFNMAIWRYNPNGSLDTSFASGGVLVFSASPFSEASAMALDANGRIVVAGTSDQAMALWRYHQDGTPDTSFDGDGMALHLNAAGASGRGNSSASALCFDTSGRILVTGRSVNAANGQEMVIWRYNTDGSLDRSFSSDGFLTYTNLAGSAGQVFGRSVVTDSSENILATGWQENVSGDTEMVIWRYSADGSPDSSFDGDGLVVYNSSTGNFDQGESIAVDATARIVVTGYTSEPGNGSSMKIWRYLQDGSPDASFDGDGVVSRRSSTDGPDAYALDVAFDSDQKILVAGFSSNTAFNTDMTLWRYGADGSADNSFNGGGVVTHNNAAGGNDTDLGTALTFDSSGKILVTGHSFNRSSGPDMAIWRYNP